MAPHRIGLVVNPIAGMGGRVGLKGSDGKAEEAIARGAKPVAPGRTVGFLTAYAKVGRGLEVAWFTAAGAMGADYVGGANVVHTPTEERTTALDTVATVKALVRRRVEVVVFVGGDGTAADVLGALDRKLPMIGVPSGVKMHSGVFAANPIAAAQVLAGFLRGEVPLGEAEVLDLDEGAMAKGNWRIALRGLAVVPQEPVLMPVGKDTAMAMPEADFVEAMANHLREMMEAQPKTLFLLGPGGTLHAVARAIGLPKTLLGIDAYVGGNSVGEDLDEAGILLLLDHHPEGRLVVSPIGAQGFILGRGNLQLSPDVLRRLGPSSLVVVSTPAKLRRTPVLRVDSGDAALDGELLRKKYLPVLVAYHTHQLHPVE